MRYDSEVERRVFEKIAPIYEQDGFNFVPPGETNVPSGTWNYEPDFLAKKGDQYVAIEIKAKRTRGVERSLETLKAQIERDKNWKFVAYYASEELQQEPIKKAGKELILETLAEVRKAGQIGFLKPAFLMAWGAFEGAAREAHSRFFAKPQTPGRIITVLADRGDFTPDEADRLRRLANLRNGLIHGKLDSGVTLADLEFLADLAERVVQPD
jgi:hypothetical protein